MMAGDGVIPLLAILLLHPALQGEAQWWRSVNTGKGTWIDVPAARPMSYFRVDAALRNDSGRDECSRCTAAEKTAKVREGGVRVKVTRAGMIAGFPIYDVFYYWREETAPAARSVLVERGAGRYHELYYQQRVQDDATIERVFFLNAGKERLLGIEGRVGGLYGLTYDAYYWFDGKGPRWVDIESLWNAARKTAVPKGRHVYTGNFYGKSTMPALKLIVPLRDDNAARCCAEGRVEVAFTIERGSVVVRESRFIP